MWVSLVRETLTGWRGRDDCVICDGTLYFLIYLTIGLGSTENLRDLLTFNLSCRSIGIKIDIFILVPWCLTCGRLMNLKDKLLQVGGIGKQDQPGIIVWLKATATPPFDCVVDIKISWKSTHSIVAQRDQNLLALHHSSVVYLIVVWGWKLKPYLMGAFWSFA